MKTIRILLLLIISLLALHCVSFAAGVDVLSELTGEATLDPGGKTDGRILLRNTSDKPWQVKVHQTDYLFYADGSNLYGNPGSAQRSNSAWITFTPKEFTIPPKETYSVYYTVCVPNDENLSGTFWSMLMVEPVAEGGLEAPKAEQGKVKLGVRTTIRYGVQIVTNIADSGKRDISFLDKRLLVSDNGRVLQLDIENKGDRWLKPDIRVELYDERGTYVGRFSGGHTRIYPSCGVRVPIALENLKQGKYNALVVVDNGDQYAWGAQYLLDIK